MCHSQRHVKVSMSRSKRIIFPPNPAHLQGTSFQQCTQSVQNGNLGASLNTLSPYLAEPRFINVSWTHPSVFTTTTFWAIVISCQDYTNGSILFSSHSSNPSSGLRPKSTSWNPNVIVLPLPPAPLEIPQWLLSTLLIKMCLPDTSYKVLLMSPAHSFCSSHTACLFLQALSILPTFIGLLQMLNPPSISSLVDSNLWTAVTSLQGVTCPSCVTLAKKALLIPW